MLTLINTINRDYYYFNFYLIYIKYKKNKKYIVDKLGGWTKFLAKVGSLMGNMRCLRQR